MKPLFYLVTALAVMGLAYWAYQENYRTQAALSELEHTNREIGRTRDSIAVLRAEWAYQNRPERLRDLALMNFNRLGLMPLTPGHFARVDQIAFPATTALHTVGLGDDGGGGQ